MRVRCKKSLAKLNCAWFLYATKFHTLSQKYEKNEIKIAYENFCDYSSVATVRCGFRFVRTETMPLQQQLPRRLNNSPSS